MKYVIYILTHHVPPHPFYETLAIDVIPSAINLSLEENEELEIIYNDNEEMFLEILAGENPPIFVFIETNLNNPGGSAITELFDHELVKNYIEDGRLLTLANTPSCLQRAVSEIQNIKIHHNSFCDGIPINNLLKMVEVYPRIISILQEERKNRVNFHERSSTSLFHMSTSDTLPEPLSSPALLTPSYEGILEREGEFSAKIAQSSEQPLSTTARELGINPALRANFNIVNK